MPDASSWSVTAAQPDWDGELPVDPETGDIYFSRAGGPAESLCVFLEGNHLAERWRTLDPTRPGVFVIGETGFGSGLNFLLACQLWEQCAPADWSLHYLAVEYRPWTRSDLQRAHRNWPELQSWSAALLDQWPCLLRGPQRLHPRPGRVSMTLLFDDVETALQQAQGPVHAWFLDGYAPAQNPRMWSPAVCRELGRLSEPGTTFGTYTAAGAVRAALAEAGFEVQRLPGHAGKRHRLAGSWQAATTLPIAPARPRTALVIGAGFAGCAVARALALRGMEVRVIDAGEQAGNAASAVPRAVMYLKLSGACSDIARLQLQAYALAADWRDQYYMGPQVHGMLQLAPDDAQAQRWQNLAGVPEDLLRPVSRAEAGAIAGLDPGHGGLWFPRAGAVSGTHWCAGLLRHPGITLQANTAIGAIAADSAGGWTAQPAVPEAPAFHSDILVLATGNGLPAGVHLHEIALHAVRGQLTRLQLQGSEAPDCVVAGKGHLVPMEDGRVYVGSTYDRENLSADIRSEDDARNLQIAQSLYAGEQGVTLAVTDAWAQLRCAGPDHLPIAGELPGHAGLYLCTALRSRGLLFTPLLAELIASHACNEPSPVTATQSRMLSATRFETKARRYQ